MPGQVECVHAVPDGQRLLQEQPGVAVAAVAVDEQHDVTILPGAHVGNTPSADVGSLDAIVPYERSLGERFLAGIGDDAVTVYGLPDMAGRVPTFLVNVAGVAAEQVAARLAETRIGVWAHHSWYSLDLYKRLGYTDEAIRIGFIHYNTAEEVDRLLEGLATARSGG